MAGRLCEFVDGRMYEVLGYETQEEWLAGPEIELQKSQVAKMVRVYRAIVLEREVQHAALEGVDLDKLDYALPAIKAGKVAWQDAVADAKNLGRRDMRERYRGDGVGLDDGLDAEREPVKIRCDHCGSWVPPDRLSGAPD